MAEQKPVVGFIGAGGIAHSHAYALNSMKYYYNDSPETEKEAVCSSSRESRESFAERYGFRYPVCPDDFFRNERIDTVFILGPNKVHYEHLSKAVMMPSVRRIYVEKPLCATLEEEKKIKKLYEERKDIKIQVGFQFLFSPAVREAYHLWKSGILGRPVHFEFRYYHGDYLSTDYRSRRRTRLTPSPEGGAMADLGSHIISIIVAFIGDSINIVNAIQAGGFDDVPADSDLFSLITLHDPVTRAAGVLSASRISSGTGDMLSFELYAEKGSLKYSTCFSDYFEYFTEESGMWHRVLTGSNYRPITSVPSGHVPPGWLRALVHAHYVFLTSNDNKSFIPNLAHGLSVQRILRESAEHLKVFRRKTLG